MQSISVVVPGGCPNRCKCCVSKLHTDGENVYRNQIEKNYQFEDLYQNDYYDAMSFARDNGCNTMMYTGDGEPLMNKGFIRKVVEINKQLNQPFRWNEIQTTGVFLTKKSEENGGETNLRWLRNYVRIKTISLSLFNIFDSNKNAEYSQPQSKAAFVDIEKTCKAIKKYDFTLRLSLNMVDFYNDVTPEEIFQRARELGANQITFRVLYNIDNPTNKEEQEISDWIREHKVKDEKIQEINDYIKKHGRILEQLPFGAYRYSLHGMSVVVDDDCMSTKEGTKEVKYLVLRPNCKVYTKWDDEGSIIF
ncbi:hypothetical protein P148_SR1C00001G0815 [candidate division SR1 bacterium RAAC1_SR1_1]|nr:hypothetical protein P148_SR1C00001G0815 [candidate division SR1 bacterium RAAC1_SR1_1]